MNEALHYYYRLDLFALPWLWIINNCNYIKLIPVLCSAEYQSNYEYISLFSLPKWKSEIKLVNWFVLTLGLFIKFEPLPFSFTSSAIWWQGSIIDINRNVRIRAHAVVSSARTLSYIIHAINKLIFGTNDLSQFGSILREI